MKSPGYSAFIRPDRRERALIPLMIVPFPEVRRLPVSTRPAGQREGHLIITKRRSNHVF